MDGQTDRPVEQSGLSYIYEIHIEDYHCQNHPLQRIIHSKEYISIQMVNRESKKNKTNSKCCLLHEYLCRTKAQPCIQNKCPLKVTAGL